jgi:hypothetical protein
MEHHFVQQEPLVNYQLAPESLKFLLHPPIQGIRQFQD